VFVQFIEGSVQDPQALHGQLERWLEQCASGADGWLGTTAGVTPGGRAFVAARFGSAAQARANSGRPEQSAWWAETEPLFDGPASFADFDEVDLLRGGGSDDAGFVQVIRGRVNDVQTARALFLDMPDDLRPDVIGGIFGMLPDGNYTTVVYFTSERDARAGEAEEADDEDFAQQMAALHDDPPRYLDLTDPWVWSP
jgi:hypothetical protein